MHTEIKADEVGKHEYDTELRKLQYVAAAGAAAAGGGGAERARGRALRGGRRIAREECEERLARNRLFAAKFDKEIGPFEAKYHTLTTDIHGLYGNAKGEHEKGLSLLVRACVRTWATWPGCAGVALCVSCSVWWCTRGVKLCVCCARLVSLHAATGIWLSPRVQATWRHLLCGALPAEVILSGYAPRRRRRQICV